MSTLYFIHEIVEHSDEFDDILDELEFVVIPVANPDGYAYTHMTDRQWNKNRRFNSGNPTCPGVDLNANFNHAFQTRPGDVSDFFFKCNKFLIPKKKNSLRNAHLPSLELLPSPKSKANV